jgi:hypothetical protein
VVNATELWTSRVKKADVSIEAPEFVSRFCTPPSLSRLTINTPVIAPIIRTLIATAMMSSGSVKPPWSCRRRRRRGDPREEEHLM